MATNQSQYEEMCEVYERYNKGDLVPVVRCKDCKYTTIDNDVVRRNCGLHLVVNLNDDDFCSRGERKE